MTEITQSHQSLIEDFLAESHDRVQITQDWYKARIRPYLQFLEDEDATLAKSGPREVKRYMATLLKAGFSWNTRNGTHTALKVFYEWLVARGHVKQSPFEMETIKRPRKMKQIRHLVELETLQALFDTLRAEETLMARRDYAIILLMFDTGLRRAEAAWLQISDVNMKRGKIAVRKAKNGNQREVPCKGPVLEVVQAWLDAHPNKEENQLFVALKGQNKYRSLSPRTVNGIVARWIKKAELEGPKRVTPHDLRRAFATYFSDTGGDMFVLQDILGHESIETTKAYVINTSEHLQMQHEKHSPINLLNLGNEQAEVEHVLPT